MSAQQKCVYTQANKRKPVPAKKEEGAAARACKMY